MFRNSGNSIRTINLRYSDGSSTTINKPGHLNMTMHLTILKALEQRATRYQVKGKLSEVGARSHSWGLDEAGTIDMICLGDVSQISVRYKYVLLAHLAKVRR